MEKIEAPAEPSRWSIIQRLEFIESRLIWEGRINRSDIAKRFNVKVQQASADLGLYERLAPENMIYDRNERTFVPARTFVPRYVREVADRPLLQLAAIGAGLVNPAETWFDELPPIAVLSVPQRHVPTIVMRWILEAIRKNAAIEIDYQSVERPNVMRRTIVPHALGNDGDRWHARAWCPRDRIFKDFVLSRIAGVGALAPSRINPAADREWEDYVEVVLTPNPKLPEASRRSIAIEYDMVRARLRLPVRAALAYYMLRRFNYDLKDIPPARQQLTVANAPEVEAFCENSKAAMLAAVEAGEHESKRAGNAGAG
jgi:hypothetical protein